MKVTKAIVLSEEENRIIVDAMNILERLSKEIFEENGNLHSVIDIIDANSEYYNGMYVEINPIIIDGSDE